MRLAIENDGAAGLLAATAADTAAVIADGEGMLQGWLGVVGDLASGCWCWAARSQINVLIYSETVKIPVIVRAHTTSLPGPITNAIKAPNIRRMMAIGDKWVMRRGGGQSVIQGEKRGSTRGREYTLSASYSHSPLSITLLPGAKAKYGSV